MGQTTIFQRNYRTYSSILHLTSLLVRGPQSLTVTMTSAETTATITAPSSTTEKIDALKKLAARKTSRSSRSSRSSASMKSGGSTSADSGDESSFISNGSTTGPEYLEPTEAHYLWGCELTRKNSTHAIKFPMDADPENESHALAFKSATLGSNAEEKERNIVEIHYFDREEKEVRQVLTTLTDGRDITLKLIKGSGPVSLLGNHVVESFVNVDADEEDEDFTPGDSTAEGETTDASGMETEGDEVEADEVKDLTEDAKEVGKAEKPRQAKK